MICKIKTHANEEMLVIACEILCHLYVVLVEIRTKVLAWITDIVYKPEEVPKMAWDDAFASHEPKKCKWIHRLKHMGSIF